MVTGRVHGGPDARGAAPHDFSQNANAAGPCPVALRAIAEADATRYPDPSYTQLRERLAAHHGVAAWRIVPAASASEFVQRITAWAARSGLRSVSVPQHAFGDYAHAARVWNLEVTHAPEAGLCWACEPSSPAGVADAHLPALVASTAWVVLDQAYEPLRLEGEPTPVPRDSLWQLWTPNKALGLTGVRAAYAIAPLHGEAMSQALQSMAPSWPIGSHGVALLQAWCEPAAQDWLARSRVQLREWKALQVQLLTALGWQCEESGANFFLATPPRAVPWQALREQGIALRDCASFGLPGRVRLSVQAPEAQQALRRAWEAFA